VEVAKTSFKTTLLAAGKTATGIEVPKDIVEALGSGQRPAVRATINGYTYRSTVAVMGGRFMLGVSADVRAKAGVAAGDRLDVVLEIDTDKRTFPAPPELKKLFAQDRSTKKVYDSLSFSRQRAIAEPIASAKTDATRNKHLARAVEMLTSKS
jgi:hypothetical protein